MDKPRDLNMARLLGAGYITPLGVYDHPTRNAMDGKHEHALTHVIGANGGVFVTGPELMIAKTAEVTESRMEVIEVIPRHTLNSTGELVVLGYFIIYRDDKGQLKLYVTESHREGWPLTPISPSLLSPGNVLSNVVIQKPQSYHPDEPGVGVTLRSVMAGTMLNTEDGAAISVRMAAAGSPMSTEWQTDVVIDIPHEADLDNRYGNEAMPYKPFPLVGDIIAPDQRVAMINLDGRSTSVVSTIPSGVVTNVAILRGGQNKNAELAAFLDKLYNANHRSYRQLLTYGKKTHDLTGDLRTWVSYAHALDNANAKSTWRRSPVKTRVILTVSRYQPPVLSHKIAGRHGDKATVTYIHTPETQWETQEGGMIIDVAHGESTINRLNPARKFVLEIQSGLSELSRRARAEIGMGGFEGGFETLEEARASLSTASASVQFKIKAMVMEFTHALLPEMVPLVDDSASMLEYMAMFLVQEQKQWDSEMRIYIDNTVDRKWWVKGHGADYLYNQFKLTKFRVGNDRIGWSKLKLVVGGYFYLSMDRSPFLGKGTAALARTAAGKATTDTSTYPHATGNKVGELEVIALTAACGGDIVAQMASHCGDESELIRYLINKGDKRYLPLLEDELSPESGMALIQIVMRLQGCELVLYDPADDDIIDELEGIVEEGYEL